MNLLKPKVNRVPPERRVDPSGAALKLLERHGILNAPVPVDRIAKTLGAEIRYSPLDEELSGMIYLKDDRPIIGVNALHHPHRQRFTIAHEIGHLIMHRDLLTGQVHVDKKFQIDPVLRRDGVSSQGTDRIEVEANQFAAALLAPKFILEKVLGDELFDIDDERPVEDLAKKLRVSKLMLLFSIKNLIR